MGSLNPLDYTVAYYLLQNDAESNQNQITSATNFINTTAFSQTVYVRAWENANATNYSVLNLNLEINTLPDFRKLDFLSIYEEPYDGAAEINLNDQTDVINSFIAGYYDVTYYTDYFEAVNNENPIIYIQNYLVYNQQTIFFRVQNPTTGCYKINSFYISINPDSIITIPDANLKSILLSANSSNSIASSHPTSNYGSIIDINNDGEIQRSEACKIYRLNVDTYSSTDNIADITGISSFDNLVSLYVSDNQFTTFNQYSFNNLINLQSLNMSGCNVSALYVNNLSNLRVLEFQYNHITSIDVSNLNNLMYFAPAANPLTALNINNLVKLESLKCYNNNLTSLDLSFFPNLALLQCEDNQITTLDTSHMNLVSLSCSYNSISTLDISTSTRLSSLNCNNNQLTSLDLTNNPRLTDVDCKNNQLTTLDLSNQINLDRLDCSDNNLSSLFIKNGKVEAPLTITNNANLLYVCADESQISNIQNIVPTALVSTCSFTPGGIYNSVTGTGSFDQANDGCDTTDWHIPEGLRLNLTDGAISSATYTNENGGYTLYAAAGNYTVNPQIENPTYFNISPASAVANFPLLDGTTQTKDFCLTANGIHNDLEVIITGGQPRPGFDVTYKLIFKNKGNQTLSGDVSFGFDDSVCDFVSALPSINNQTAGLLLWNYSNILPFETRTIDVTLNINSPTEIPAVNSGDIFNFTASINPISNDEMLFDNYFTYRRTAVNSFDPNDKTCLEGTVIGPEMIGNYLHYNINFENTGTAAAEKIVVKDIIDTTKFDISTLQVLNFSHPVVTRITGNKVEFMFDNINLAPAAHGNVVFKIKTKSDLAIGSTVSNKADIYFDYNFPIETNTATSTFQLLNTAAFETDESINVYPNPAKNQISVNSKNTIKSVQLFDMQGRIINTILVNDTKLDLNISNYSNGIYFLKVTTARGSKVEKIIKE
ncbi:MAG: T9SS type A sorting domain-containing protein [Flavobacterium sp.]|nr:T9SS type A sorting domain-containing protein [Flavobacterium sp.]